MRNVNLAKHNSNTTLARRWADRARCRCWPRRFHRANSPPRVNSLALSFLSFFARAVPSAPLPAEKRSACPPEQGLSRGTASPSNVEKGSWGNHRRFPPLLSLPFQRERKKHKTISVLVQTHLETGSPLSSFQKSSSLKSNQKRLPCSAPSPPHPSTVT